jgi:DNA-binding transcriptional MerR regulator
MSTATLQAPSLPDRLYDSEQLAQIFDVHRATILEWARTGVIPPGRRFGRSLRWTAADLTPLLASREA